MAARLMTPTTLLRLGIILVITLAIALFVGVSVAGATFSPCPPGTVQTGFGAQGPICVLIVEDEPPEDGFNVHGECDYGRVADRLWPDNPDGHPFERPFCDGNVGPDVQKHPLDTPENAGLYCDEVPGCWAYGLTLPGHH